MSALMVNLKEKTGHDSRKRKKCRRGWPCYYLLLLIPNSARTLSLHSGQTPWENKASE